MRFSYFVCIEMMCIALLSPLSAMAQNAQADESSSILSELQSRHLQVYPIVRNMRVRNAEECEGRLTKDLGLLLGVMRDPVKNSKPEVRRGLREPIVTFLIADGPAMRAGLRIGDRIDRVGERKLRRSKKLRRNLDAILKKVKDGPIPIVVSRDGEKQVFEVTPIAACDSSVMTAGSSLILVIEDLKRHKSLIAFFVAHQAAHTLLNTPKLQMPILYGQNVSCQPSLWRTFVSPGHSSVFDMCAVRRQIEMNVDKKAVELMIRAGYNPFSITRYLSQLPEAQAALAHLYGQRKDSASLRVSNIEDAARSILSAGSKHSQKNSN